MREKRLVQIHINVRVDQIATLREVWHSSGYGISELVRVAIDEFLERLRTGRHAAGNGPSARQEQKGGS